MTRSKSKQRQVRQGDVLIVPVTSIPKNTKSVKPDPKFGAFVLAYGEVTGHAHTIDAECVKTFELVEKDGTLFFSVGAPTEVKHQEHTAVPLAPGNYKAVRQQTYHRGEVKRVLD